MNNEKKYKKDQELTFDVYGSIIKGKFISQTTNVITVEVISDSTGVSNAGDHETFHKSHLI